MLSIGRWTTFQRLGIYRLVTMVKLPSLQQRHFSQSHQKAKEVLRTDVAPTTKQRPEEQLKDILIYEQQSPDFFGKLSIFCALQFIFFCVTSFAFTGLRDAPIKKDGVESLDSTVKKDDEELPIWRRVNLGESKIKNALQVSFLVIGYVILSCGWLYILKSVRYIVLRKDRRLATLVTYTPFGRNRYLDVPINNITLLGSRHDKLNTFLSIPLKVKGSLIKYRIDLRRSRFPDPTLFDNTVGRRRTFT